MINFVSNAWRWFFTTKMVLEDTNKDPQGKGTLQRFIEANMEELDSYTVDKLETLHTSVLDITTCEEQYIKHFESWFGITVFPSYINMGIRRIVASRSLYYYKKKATTTGIVSLFNLIGCNVVISEHHNDYSFDSPITLDDPIRVFDKGNCSACSTYSLAITSNSPIPVTDLYRGSYSIILFNHPIGAILASATIGGVEIHDLMLNYYVSQGGTASDITGTNGYYNFTQLGNIIPSPISSANLKVDNGQLSLNI